MLVKHGIIKARAVKQLPTFEAGLLFARTEGIIPAPETNHAIRAAIDEAIKARENKEEVIVFGFSGHGLLDLQAYDDYLSGKLADT